MSSRVYDNDGNIVNVNMVRRTRIQSNVLVETLKLPGGIPQFYEARVYGGPLDGLSGLHFGEKDAIKAHDQLVNRVRQMLDEAAFGLPLGEVATLEDAPVLLLPESDK